MKRETISAALLDRARVLFGPSIESLLKRAVPVNTAVVQSYRKSRILNSTRLYHIQDG